MTLRESNTVKQFKKFLIIGFASTAINYGVFYLFLELQVNYLVSSATGYISGLIFGYFFNRSWTFNSQNARKIKEAVSYLTVYVFSLILSVLFLRFLVEVLLFKPIIGNIFAIVLSTTTNFIGCKILVFKKCE